jgi:hypothetical protein
VATFTQLISGNWRVQVRRKTRYVVETFRRRKDGEEWARGCIAIGRQLAANVFESRNHVQDDALIEIGDEKHSVLLRYENLRPL